MCMDMILDDGGGSGGILQGVSRAFTVPIWNRIPPSLLSYRVAPMDLGKNSFSPGQGEKYLSKVVSSGLAEYAWERQRRRNAK
jgi:hypothetical protein